MLRLTNQQQSSEVPTPIDLLILQHVILEVYCSSTMWLGPVLTSVFLVLRLLCFHLAAVYNLPSLRHLPFKKSCSSLFSLLLVQEAPPPTTPTPQVHQGTQDLSSGQAQTPSCRTLCQDLHSLGHTFSESFGYIFASRTYGNKAAQV